MARKRAPGGGRKPSGPISGKLSTFSTRITRPTRAALEAEAGATAQSISQVAEQMIMLGLTTKRMRETSNPTRGLAFLITELAERCGTKFNRKEFHWNTDAFCFDALVHTARFLFERLKPPDSALTKHLHEAKDQLDELDREMFASPESWAKHIFYDLWDEVTGHRGRSGLPVLMPNEDEMGGVKTISQKRRLMELIFEQGDVRKIFQYASDLERVRRDLNLKAANSEGDKS